MAKSRGILGASGGGFGAGLLLLAGGLIVRHSQASMVAACSSGAGQFGRVLNANAARQCASAQDLSSMATGAIWVGAILLVVAVGSFIVFLASSKKPKVVMPAAGIARPAGPSRGASARSRASEGAVLRPVVPSAGGQPAVAGQPAYRPGPGCGHAVSDGARFCTVCGRPAAGERDGFGAEQPVSASGSEITTVLPVFAPPEPVGVPAPALAADRTAERSLAGVASGSQLSWSDRPSAPGGFDSGPPRGWADPPPAPGGSVSSGPPWEQVSPSPVPSVVKSGPGLSPVPAVVRSGPGPSPVPAVLKSGPGPSPVPGAVRSGPGPSPVPSVVTSGPPWEQVSPSPVPGVVRSGPGPSPVPSVVTSGPPWQQAGPSPVPSVVSSGPPWDRAEPSPASGGTGPGAEVIIPRQSGRHRSRRP